MAEIEQKARPEVATAAYLKHIGLAQEAVSANSSSGRTSCSSGASRACAWEWHYLQRRTHRCLHTLRDHAQGQTQNQNLRCVVYRPDGRQLASAGVDGSIRIWDAMTGRPVRTLSGHAGGVFRLAYRPPDGQYLASTGVNDGKVRVWDTSTGKEVFNCTHEHPSVLGVAYTPDGRQFASSSWDKTVMLWDATDGRPIRNPLVRHADVLGVLAFRPHSHGRQLACDLCNTVILLEVATGQVTHTFAGASGVGTIIAFSPGRRIPGHGRWR